MKKRLDMSKKIFLSLMMLIISSSCVHSLKLKDEMPTEIYGSGKDILRVATGSPGALGLLKELSRHFCSKNRAKIMWYKKGSGASLAFMKAGKCDIIMVHAPMAEKKAVLEGWATHRTIIGANEFFIVGPPSDPAKIKYAKNVIEAYSLIAKSKSLFFSRGDNSGTNKREKKIWKLTGINPSGSWYVVTHDFMGPTLLRADKEKGYFMTDSSTYYVYKRKLKNLVILFKGDPLLINIYHALMFNPKKYPYRNEKLALKFIDFLTSPEGQNIIKTYGIKKYGVPLYLEAQTAIRLEQQLIKNK